MAKCGDCKKEFKSNPGNEKFCTRCLAIYYASVEQDDQEGRIDYVYAEDNEPPKKEE